MVKTFELAPLPNIIFGSGTVKRLPEIAMGSGNFVLLVTGKQSFQNNARAMVLLDKFKELNFIVEIFQVPGEPSPAMIDEAVSLFSNRKPQIVVAVGGGSVLDAGKAISAMLPHGSGVKDYLEGVGTKIHSGIKVPFIAVPTTSGTGSEATKNAVLSEIGEKGFKKSLRHNNFVPDYAIVDPELVVDCPANITAASGMDAFTQLLESYLSTASSIFTDSLAIDGMKRIVRSLEIAVNDGHNLDARSDVAYAALLSGITLANAGLGVVHGYAQPLGSLFEIPHGVVCGTLMGAVNRVTVRKLREQNPVPTVLKKYAHAGRLFILDEQATDDYLVDTLLDQIDAMTERLKIPTLSKFGVREKDFNAVIAQTGIKKHPIGLDQDELKEILKLRL